MSDSGPGSSPQTLGIDLHYPPGRVANLDLTRIERRGHHLRARRRTLAGGFAVAVVAGAVGVASAVTTTPNRKLSLEQPATGTPSAQALAALRSDPLVRQHQPSSEIVVLQTPREGTTPARSSTVAWLTPDDQLCVGDGDISTPEASLAEVSCSTAPTGLTSLHAKAALLAKPTFRTKPAGQGYVLAVGYTRGIRSVRVTVDGRTVSASVVPLGVASAGAYAVWVKVPSNGHIGWSDITAIAGRDAQGAVIARIG